MNDNKTNSPQKELTMEDIENIIISNRNQSNDVIDDFFETKEIIFEGIVRDEGICAEETKNEIPNKNRYVNMIEILKETNLNLRKLRGMILGLRPFFNKGVKNE